MENQPEEGPNALNAGIHERATDQARAENEIGGIYVQENEKTFLGNLVGTA